MTVDLMNRKLAVEAEIRAMSDNELRFVRTHDLVKRYGLSGHFLGAVVRDELRLRP